MADSSFTVEVYSNQAKCVRNLLSAHLRLRVTEKRCWFFLVRFAFNGPSDAVDAATQELDEWLNEDYRQRQW